MGRQTVKTIERAWQAYYEYFFDRGIKTLGYQDIVRYFGIPLRTLKRNTELLHPIIPNSKPLQFDIEATIKFCVGRLMQLPKAPHAREKELLKRYLFHKHFESELFQLPKFRSSDKYNELCNMFLPTRFKFPDFIEDRLNILKPSEINLLTAFLVAAFHKEPLPSELTKIPLFLFKTVFSNENKAFDEIDSELNSFYPEFFICPECKSTNITALPKKNEYNKYESFNDRFIYICNFCGQNITFNMEDIKTNYQIKLDFLEEQVNIFTEKFPKDKTKFTDMLEKIYYEKYSGFLQQVQDLPKVYKMFYKAELKRIKRKVHFSTVAKVLDVSRSAVSYRIKNIRDKNKKHNTHNIFFECYYLLLSIKRFFLYSYDSEYGKEEKIYYSCINPEEGMREINNYIKKAAS